MQELKHIGFIMDGNRRWAQTNGLSVNQGHLAGYQKVEQVLDWLKKRGVNNISLYTFSTENWNRSEEEVSHLMSLIKKAFTEKLENLHKKGYKVLISGRYLDLPEGLGNICQKAIELTANNKQGIVNLCLNYGGHAEIVDAINKIQNQGKAKITADLIAENLYTDMPAPDLIVRTSGEKRLSGFLLWQSAYSELLFLEKNWPDLNEQDIDYILEEYNKRQRRFGT